MNRLQQEKLEAWLVIVGFYALLLGCCGFVLWIYWR